jgi:hypothetical protein
MRCCRRIEAHSLNADNQSGCTAIPNARVESEAYVTRGEAIAKKEIIRKPRERRCRKLAKRMKRSEGSLRQKALALGIGVAHQSSRTAARPADSIAGEVVPNISVATKMPRGGATMTSA